MRLLRLSWRCVAAAFFASAVAASQTGCATIMKGGKATVPVSSTPAGALIEVHEFGPQGPVVFSGHSPAKVHLSKKHEYVVVVSAPGYEPELVKLTQGFQGWTIGNLIFIFPLFWGAGVAVDAVSGALWTLDDDDVTLTLRRQAPEAAQVQAVAPDTAPPGPAPASDEIQDAGPLRTM